MRPDLTTERAVAATLVLMDPAVHRTLVREHRWTRPEYANWIQAHDHGRAPQGYLEGGMTGGVLTIGRLIVTAYRAARQAVPEAEGLSGTQPAAATAEPPFCGTVGDPEEERPTATCHSLSESRAVHRKWIRKWAPGADARRRSRS